MDVRPIRSDADYTAALADIEQYFEHEPGRGTPEADRFDVLATLINAYEREHWPVDAPDALSAISRARRIARVGDGYLAGKIRSGDRDRPPQCLIDLPYAQARPLFQDRRQQAAAVQSPSFART